jgi:hypothetical protein
VCARIHRIQYHKLLFLSKSNDVVCRWFWCNRISQLEGNLTNDLPFPADAGRRAIDVRVQKITVANGVKNKTQRSCHQLLGQKMEKNEEIPRIVQPKLASVLHSRATELSKFSEYCAWKLSLKISIALPY